MPTQQEILSRLNKLVAMSQGRIALDRLVKALKLPDEDSFLDFCLDSHIEGITVDWEERVELLLGLLKPKVRRTVAAVMEGEEKGVPRYRVAEQLGISERTVRNHMTLAQEVLGAYALARAQASLAS